MFSLQHNKYSYNSLFKILHLGRQFDKEGNISPWWNEETISAFNEQAKCFIDMYDSYAVPELIHILGDEAHVR